MLSQDCFVRAQECPFHSMIGFRSNARIMTTILSCICIMYILCSGNSSENHSSISFVCGGRSKYHRAWHKQFHEIEPSTTKCDSQKACSSDFFFFRFVSSHLLYAEHIFSINKHTWNVNIHICARCALLVHCNTNRDNHFRCYSWKSRSNFVFVVLRSVTASGSYAWSTPSLLVQ